jgi:ribosome-associated toxin RatA of RatAB toxin-antitoxin module
MRPLLRTLVLSAAVLRLVAAPAPGAAGEPAAEDRQARLARGEVLLSAALPDDAEPGAAGGTATALVRATPEAVWQVLVDYAGHASIFPRVAEASILEAEPGRTLVRYVIGAGPLSFTFHVNNYPDPGHRRLEWRLAQDRRNGLFRANCGYWRLEPGPGGVVLTYAIAARTVLPAFLTRGAEREGLLETIKAVRRRAEAISPASAGPRPEPSRS